MNKASKYKYVYCNHKKRNGEIINKWHTLISPPVLLYSWQKIFNTEREAAIAVDIKLIEAGRWPVNILKRKGLNFERYD